MTDPLRIDLRVNPNSALPISHRSYSRGYTKGRSIAERQAQGLPPINKDGTYTTTASLRQLEWRAKNNLTMVGTSIDSDLVNEFKAGIKEEDGTLRQALEEAVMLWLIDREMKQKKS
jgi:hypothetical protein